MTSAVRVPAGPVEELAWQLAAAGLPEPVAEYPFAAELGRRWRFDLAWPDRRLAVEVEGGLFGRGGRGSNRPCPTCGQGPAGAHRSVAGVKRDIEKGNAAVALGWRVLRVLPGQVESGEALALIERVVAGGRDAGHE